MNRTEVGKRLRLYRIQEGIKQKDVAEKLGITAATLCNYEKGLYIDEKTARQIAHTLGIDVNWLLYGEEEPEQQPDPAADSRPTLSDIDIVTLLRGQWGIPDPLIAILQGYASLPRSEQVQAQYFLQRIWDKAIENALPSQKNSTYGGSLDRDRDGDDSRTEGVADSKGNPLRRVA